MVVFVLLLLGGFQTVWLVPILAKFVVPKVCTARWLINGFKLEFQWPIWVILNQIDPFITKWVEYVTFIYSLLFPQSGDILKSGPCLPLHLSCFFFQQDTCYLYKISFPIFPILLFSKNLRTGRKLPVKSKLLICLLIMVNLGCIRLMTKQV